MKHILTPFFLLLTVLCTACESSEKTITPSTEKRQLVERTINIGSFDAVQLEGNIHVFYTQAATSLKAKATADQLEYLSASVKGNTLILKTNYPSFYRNNSKAIEVYVCAPQLTKLDMRGACEFKADDFKTTNLRIGASGATDLSWGTITCNQIRIETAGAAEFKGNIKAADTQLDARGACEGRLNIAGGNLTLRAAGSSDLEVDFKGNRVDAGCNGAGDIDLTVDCRELRAKNAGACQMAVRGTADDVEINNAGVATINTKDLNKF